MLLQAAFVVSIIVLIVAAAIAAVVWLNTPQAPGNFGPKYLLWYANPLRKISWRFPNFIGMGGGTGQRVVIYGFQASMKVNRGDGIIPKAAWVESLRTGTKRTVRFDVDHSGNCQSCKRRRRSNSSPPGHG
jgi:hypothetical protein